MKRKICDFCRKIFSLPAWLTMLIAVPAFALQGENSFGAIMLKVNDKVH